MKKEGMVLPEKKENNLNEVVENVFTGWENLRKLILQNPGSADLPAGSVKYVRSLMGGYASRVDSEEFKKCIQAVNIAIGQNELKNKKEKIDENENESNSKGTVAEFNKQLMLSDSYALDKKRKGEAKMLGIDENEIS